MLSVIFFQIILRYSPLCSLDYAIRCLLIELYKAHSNDEKDVDFGPENHGKLSALSAVGQG